ncbi:MAG: ParB N-terminal domain-containing protein [Pseudolabrys sp.]
MLKPEKFPIDKIYVPLKKRKTLNAEAVQEIAESILQVGQQAPILVRPDEGRYVLVEGLHRLEACKALGEETIIGLLVSAQVARQDAVLPADAHAEAERQKTERLRKLRLEKEAAEKSAVETTSPKSDSAAQPRERAEKHIENKLKATAGRRNRGNSESAATTLSEWVAQQEREGNRY